MNTPGLFVVGAVVMLIVGAAIALLLYGAVLDGRDERRAGGAGPPHPEPVTTAAVADRDR
jgi:hypothetical protein